MRARWLAMLSLTALLAAQTPPQPVSISGTVTNSVTSEPVMRAHVTVRCDADNEPPGQQTYGALTNAKGEFSIAPLKGGACWVTADRVGFVADAQNYPLAAGAHKDDLKLKLTPTGAITGRVSNAAGEPMQRVDVSAEMGGGNVANNASNAMTDDKGEYRIGGLRPGKYRVKVTSQNLPLPPEIRSDGSVELRDATTYYPNSMGAKSAQRVDVRAGTEVSGIDIKMMQTPVTRVSGTVTGIPPGIKDVMVNIQPNGQGSSVKPDGTFTIWRLDPGKYTIRAQKWGPSQLSSAPSEIEVTTANLDHLELRIVEPFEVAGQLRFDDEQAREAPKAPTRPDGSTPKIPPQPRRVTLLSLHDRNATNERPIGTDDSFTLPKVQPGRYRVVVAGVSGYVKSIRAGMTETEGEILDVRNGSPGPISVTLSSNYCEVSGTVTDSNGPVSDAQVVMVMADDPTNPRVMRTSSTGAFKTQVPPGKYTIAAVDDSSLNWGPDGPDLEGYETETLDLSAGDKVTKDLVRRKQ